MYKGEKKTFIYRRKLQWKEKIKLVDFQFSFASFRHKGLEVEVCTIAAGSGLERHRQVNGTERSGGGVTRSSAANAQTFRKPGPARCGHSPLVCSQGLLLSPLLHQPVSVVDPPHSKSVYGSPRPPRVLQPSQSQSSSSLLS